MAKRLNGKIVEDAKLPMCVRVTRRDVSGANQKDPTTCAIARGCMHHNRVLSVRVGGRIVLVEYKDKVVRYSLKSEDQRKVKAFDAARYFQPAIYELIPPTIKLGEKTVNHVRKGDGKRRKDVWRSAPIRHACRVNGKGVAVSVGEQGEHSGV